MPLLEPTPPKSLIQLEHWFAALITSPFHGEGEHRLPVYDKTLTLAIEERIAPGPTLRASERIGIYHQQYWWRLFGMLHEQYPTLTRLFGYGDFNAFIAEPYFLKYPPSTWFIPYLGRFLPRFLETHYHEADRSLVLAVAEIDEVHERLFHVPQNSVLLQLEGDLFTFRDCLLEKPVEEWLTSDFPPIEWFPEKRSFSVYRTERGIEHEEQPN
jgi:hypothetical protein